MRIAAYRLIALAGAVALVVFAVRAPVRVWEPALLPVAFYLAGLVGFAARPANPTTGRLMGFGTMHLTAYALATVSGGWASLVANALYGLAFAVFVTVFAVFPTGAYERRYERVVARAAVVGGLVVTALGLAGRARLRPVLDDLGHSVTNPLHLGGAAGVEQLVILGLPTAVVLFALRYRRAVGEERAAMRWPLVAAIGGAVTLALYLPLGASTGLDAVFVTFFVLLPVSLVVAMVRHRLFDVEVVIRSSVVFGGLWVVIALVYAAVASVLGIAAGTRLPTAAAVLVAIVAAMAFEPARRRLERVADRVVYGERRDGYAAIRALGRRLEHAVEPDQIAATVREGLGARWARVVTDGAPPSPDAALTADLVHAGERVGHIEVGSGDFRPSDADLLDDLARQAAPAVHNAHLTAELAARLREVESSRARLVQAEEAERRRIERDIHDGLQQEIVAVLARVELARAQLSLAPDDVEGTLAGAADLIRQAHADLRELVRGIHPAVLGDRGLAEAIAARAARLPVAVDIEAADGLDDVRFAPEVEGAAYFIVSEALANVMKHAGAERAVVRLAARDGGLRVEIADAGRGFDLETVEGTGLRGLRDRAEALGGALEVVTAPGEGTRIVAALGVRDGVRG